MENRKVHGYAFWKIINQNWIYLRPPLMEVIPYHCAGKQVEFQTRKMSKTTNALYLTDNQGIPIAM